MKKNSALRALIKHINIIIVLLILSLATSIWLLYENHTYDRLLNEKDALIHRLQVRDSISSELLNIQETDTSFYYVVSKDDDGKALSYSELDSLMWYYKIEADIKDKIIVHSKNIYHFNYSVKRDDDGHILLKFWNKK